MGANDAPADGFFWADIRSHSRGHSRLHCMDNLQTYRVVYRSSCTCDGH
jgi:hypothetical protein